MSSAYEHFDPACPLCRDLRDVQVRARAALWSPITHVRFQGYARWIHERLTLHMTVRHDPRSLAIAPGIDEASALDREDEFTIGMLREMRTVLDRFNAAIAAGVETTT